MIGLYLFAALTLIGRGKYLRDRAGWVQRGVHLAPETGSDLGTGALIGAAALILLAWNLPLNIAGMHVLESQWQAITRPWRATRDRLGRAFDALEGHNAAERVEYFRSALPLGSRAAQGSALVFTVSAPPEATELPRLYWRARVYGHYQNGGWSESQAVTGKLSPAEDGLSIPDMAGRQEYEFAITSYSQGQAMLSLPAQPLWVSRPADVTSFPLPDGTQDVLFLQIFPFLEPGETYRVRAAMANPSIQELRAAGQDYPDWVKERYLQLPDDFSPKVRNYASQITFGQSNPYEKAQTVTTVLRAQITYQPNITLPPAGTDIMEWFLFEGRKGFCNYYATAEVLMLRSLGVPARLAVGFAQGEATEGAQRPGETEATTQEFSVYLKHMHAWPEIYFPGIGWVEFEPTGNQPALIRPAAPRADLQPAAPPEAGQPPPLHRPDLEPEPEETGDKTGLPAVLRRWLTPLLWTASLLLGAAALRGCYAFANRKYALTTRAAEYLLVAVERRGERGPAWVKNAALYVLANPFERAFHPVNLSLRCLGESPAAHLTPAERAESLSARLPEAAGEIETLLKEYHASQYARRGGNLPSARRAGRRLLWLGLRAAVGQRARMIK
jgi:transglutaminase-like putative cysteine protease